MEGANMTDVYCMHRACLLSVDRLKKKKKKDAFVCATTGFFSFQCSILASFFAL